MEALTLAVIALSSLSLLAAGVIRWRAIWPKAAALGFMFLGCSMGVVTYYIPNPMGYYNRQPMSIVIVVAGFFALPALFYIAGRLLRAVLRP